MAVAAQIRHHRLGVGETGLGVDHPVAGHQRIEHGLGLERLAQALEPRDMGEREDQVMVGRGQHRAKLALAPLRRGPALAARAVTVAAGVVSGAAW